MNKVPILELIETKSGNLSLKMNDYYLHSKYDPIKEASIFVDAFYKENHLHILFGYGLGYIASALTDKMKSNDQLIIIDPNIDELKEVTKINKRVIDMDERKIELIVKEDLKGALVNVTVICSPNYDKIFMKEYNKLLTIVRDIQLINRLQRNTINFFANSWQENYMRNIIHVFKDSSLKDLKNKINSPIVIASGGPSLIKQIPIIKKNRNKFVLIAAGSTINTLKHYGVIADYVVSVDGGENNYRHFENEIDDNTKLIYDVRNHYKIREKFSSNCYAFNSVVEDGIEQYIKRLTNKELPVILGGTSVAVFALNIALYISTGEVAIIGQDLAYTDNKTHAEYNKNFKKIDEEYLKTNKLFFTDGYYEEEVLTDITFISMKKDFERLIEIVKQPERIYNCTEGGANIKGIKQKKFEEFCEPLNRKPDEKYVEIEKENDFHFLKKRIENEIKLLKSLSYNLKKAITVLNSNANKVEFDLEVRMELDKIDKKLKKIFKKTSMDSIIDPIVLDTMNNFLPNKKEKDKEKFIRVFKQNHQLYTRLLEATNLNTEYTCKLLNEINERRS